MRRRLFNLAAALSLVLCVVSTAASVRSYLAGDWLKWHAPDPPRSRWTGYEVFSAGGALYLSVYEKDFKSPEDVWNYIEVAQPGAGWLHFTAEPVFTPLDDSFWSRRGFFFMIHPGYDGGGGATTQRTSVVSFPYWCCALLTAILPAAELLRWYRRRKHVAGGLCLCCGYDLRASPDRCPECGAAATPKATAA